MSDDRFTEEEQLSERPNYRTRPADYYRARAPVIDGRRPRTGRVTPEEMEAFLKQFEEQFNVGKNDDAR